MRILLKQHEFRLDAYVKDVSFAARALQLAAEDGAGAVGPRLVIDVKIPGNPGDILAPGEDGERAEIGDAHDVGIVRSLIQIARREARKARAVARHLIQVRGGNEFGFGRTAELHERAKEVVDTLVFDEGFDLIEHDFFL